MSVIKKSDKAPSFSILNNSKKIAAIHKEIEKFQPEAEVSIEGYPDVAKGNIVEWHSSRKFFVVEWLRKSKGFDQKTESESGLRVFFKSRLFSTQILFKSTTLRRSEDGGRSHFRIPEEIYQQQLRSALRVPILTNDAILKIPQGEFKIIDLSLGGAKVKIPTQLFNKNYVGIIIDQAQLYFGNRKITHPELKIKIANIQNEWMGIKLSGLRESDETVLKQYLVEALQVFYQSITEDEGK